MFPWLVAINEIDFSVLGANQWPSLIAEFPDYQHRATNHLHGCERSPGDADAAPLMLGSPSGGLARSRL